MKTKIRFHTSNPIDNRVRVSLDMCYKAELTNILPCNYQLSKSIYSNKKETSDFHGTVSFNPVKMTQQI